MHKPGCQFPIGNSAAKCQQYDPKRLQIQDLGTVYTAVVQEAVYSSCTELATEQAGGLLTSVL